MAESQAGMDDEEMVGESNFIQKTYGWFAIVNRVAENDITKHEVIYQKKLIEVLNQTSYLLDLEKEQIKMMKSQVKTI